ncbi:MAG: Asp-tRNA(Asn)/Glu-tRNA(Gln) amidotransferase subunit GatC [Candidatus Pacebacteria bacterium]|nr:Asp-tRNA(Asn)/Glu-tRNA(Gln) amidotransferase subunit GatC [Candidatus Paceibacterota bacterium]
MPKIDQSLTKHIANLANIPISDQEAGTLAKAFQETLKVVNKLQSLDVEGVEETHQVTGLSNVLREDEVDEKRMFTQGEALANAPQKNGIPQTHSGYFVVERIITKEN